MNEVEYNGILLTEENIKKLAQEGQIDKDFPYLDNIVIMIPAIIANPSLIKLFPEKKYWALNDKIFAKDIPDDIKKECLYYSLEKFFVFPSSCDNLLEDREFLIRLANKNIMTYVKMLDNAKKYDEETMRLIFKEKYEDKYVYNPDGAIYFGLSSPRTLLNTIKINRYYIDRFLIDAYNDEVIDYIIENKIYASPSAVMYSIPKITIARLKEDVEFLYQLSPSYLNGDVVEYLKSINYEIDYNRLSKTSIYPPKFIIYLLSINLNNVMFIIDERSIDEEVIKFLKEHNYVYKKGDFDKLLEYDDIIESTVLNGNLDFIIMNDIKLSNRMCEFIIQYLNNNDYRIKTIKNKKLLENEKFILYLNTKYSNSNPFNLDNSKRYSNVARSINDEFVKYFSKEVVDIIIDQIVLNNYYIDLESILKNIKINKFYELYQKLANLEFKFNSSFSFYYFIKVCNFFVNHLELLKEINDSELDEVMINNLLLVINNNETEINNLHDLRMYRDLYKKKIINATQIDLKDQIFRILINSDTIGTFLFLNNILNLENAIYLQLEFKKDSKEYQYLELCIELISTLENIMKIDDEEILKKILYDIAINYEMDARSNINSLTENIKTLYAMVYIRESINKDELRKKGKIEEIDGVLIYHLEGEDFHLFSHRLDFNQEDKYRINIVENLFEDFDRNDPKFANYVCTTHESKYDLNNLNNEEAVVYELMDIYSLIAFGNDDINIRHTNKPLFCADNSFVNPIDMSFIHKGTTGYTETEFDFLRKNNHNQIVGPRYLICKDRENVRKKTMYAKKRNMGIIIIDYKKNQEMLMEEYLNYIENIDKLTYKEIYKLIALSTKRVFGKLDDNLINAILKAIERFTEKERYLILKTLNKYGYDVLVVEYKHNNHK